MKRFDELTQQLAGLGSAKAALRKAFDDNREDIRTSCHFGPERAKELGYHDKWGTITTALHAIEAQFDKTTEELVELLLNEDTQS